MIPSLNCPLIIARYRFVQLSQTQPTLSIEYQVSPAAYFY